MQDKNTKIHGAFLETFILLILNISYCKILICDNAIQNNQGIKLSLPKDPVSANAFSTAQII